MNPIAMRCALGAIFMLGEFTTASAAPASYEIIGDELDAGALSATLPQGPVDQALAELKTSTPAATVLVPARTSERNGVRYALAAWRSDPQAPRWDALLVVATSAGARILEATSTARDIEATLAALLAHALGSAPPAPVVVAPKKVEWVPLPERWDVRFVVLFAPNPEYQTPADPAAAQRVVDAHIQYQLRLQRDGIAVAGGPFAEGDAHADLVGMTVLRVKDLATAQSIAMDDPAVIAGRMSVTVREWRLPAGRLP